MRQTSHILVAFLLCFFAAYPLGAREAEYQVLYEDALRRLNEGDVNAAVIQAKNALLENPTHLPSRILLGNIYVRQGRGADSEKELKIAMELGAARDSIMLPLGDALLLQRKYQEILDTVVADTPRLRRVAEIYTLRARAQYELGHLDLAQQGFEQAQGLAPETLGPLLGLSQVALRRSRIAEAEQLITRARAIAPDSAEAWHHTGNVLRASGDLEAALAAYSRTLELSEGHMRARMTRARVYIQLNQYQNALADARWATDQQKYDPEPPFLASQALVQLDQPEEARAALLEAGSRLSQIKTDYVTTRPGLMRMAAMLNFAQGNMEQANRYLELYVEVSPYDVEMRKILGKVKLQMGDTDGAIRALYPAHRIHKEDGELLYLLGDALLRAGRYGEASNLLEQSIASDSETSRVVTRLALSRMGLGQSELALADLEKALAMDNSIDNLQAGVILATVYIKRGKLEEALEVAQTLMSRAPDNPVTHNLAGLVYLAMDKPEKAWSAFEASHKRANSYAPAIYNLALMEQARGDLLAAEGYYNLILAMNKTAVRAMLGMSDIALQRKDKEQAISWLTQAVAQQRDSLEPSIRLINLYLATDRFDDAFIEVEVLRRMHTEKPEVYVLYGRVHTARGELEEAVKSYRAAARYTGFSGEDLLQIAAAQQRIRDFDGALKTLQKALDTNLALEARAATVTLNIQLNDLPAAMAAAAEVVKESPDSNVGYLLQGHVQFAGKQYRSALKSYRLAHKISPGRDSTLGMFKALTLLEEHAKARSALQDWLNLHPQDTFVRRNLAVAYITVGDQISAQGEFERLYSEGHRGPVVLVHLARIYQLRGDSRAREYAKQGLAANSSWAVAIDTYGWILVTEGEPEAGLKYLREAVSRDSNPTIRYHLAATLSELGRKKEARIELKSVLRSKAGPSLLAAAKKLDDELANAEAP